MQPRRRSSLVGVASLGLLTVVVGAACGGAIDNTDLFSKDQGTAGTTGTAPTATATATPAPTPSGGPTPIPPSKPTAKCDVSFSTDVMQVLADKGCTSSECHGGGLPRNEPGITQVAALTYKNLVSFTLSTGKPYVAIGSSNPKASGMYCNLRGNCGVAMPPGDKLSSNDLDVIDSWLACGAPFN